MKTSPKTIRPQPEKMANFNILFFSPCVGFPMCMATNCSWSVVYWVFILECNFVTSCVLFYCTVCVLRGELSYLAPLGSENISASYFKQCFFQGGGVLPPRQSNTTPPSPKTEITDILFYILNFASIIKFKM